MIGTTTQVSSSINTTVTISVTLVPALIVTSKKIVTVC